MTVQLGHAMLSHNGEPEEVLPEGPGRPQPGDPGGPPPGVQVDRHWEIQVDQRRLLVFLGSQGVSSSVIRGSSIRDDRKTTKYLGSPSW